MSTIDFAVMSLFNQAFVSFTLLLARNFAALSETVLKNHDRVRIPSAVARIEGIDDPNAGPIETYAFLEPLWKSFLACLPNCTKLSEPLQVATIEPEMSLNNDQQAQFR